VLWPTIQQLGQEESTFWVLRIAGFSLKGWQILLFEFAVGALCVAAVVLGICILTGRE
jgi:hypothetical protein